MWLRNYKNLVTGLINGTDWASIPAKSNYNVTVPSFLDLNGNPHTVLRNYAADCIERIFVPILRFNDPGDVHGWGVTSMLLVGDGNTPVTQDDYKLSGNRISSFSSVNWTMTVDDAGYAIAAVQLEATAAVTVREIGIAKRWNEQQNDGAYMLAYREVLPAEVVLNAGDTYAFQIRMPLPGAFLGNN